MIRARQHWVICTKSYSLFTVAAAVIFLRSIAPRASQPRTFSCGERVPIEEVYVGIHRLQACEHPENEPLVPLNDLDQRRKEHPRPLKTFTPYALKWKSTDLLTGPMLFPRTILISSIVERLIALVDDKDRAAGVYCSMNSSWDVLLRGHLAKAYTLRSLSQFSIRDRERLLYSASVYRFVFVQHPLTRLHDIYQNATRDGLDSEAYRSFVSKVRGIPLGKDERVMQVLTPRFFVTFLSHLPKLPEGFVSQTESCAYSVIKYHLAGHVESFAGNVATLNRRLSMTGGAFIDSKALGRNTLQRQWMDKRVLSHIAKLYANDFHNFEYDVSLP